MRTYRINKNAARFAAAVSATAELVYHISLVTFRLQDRYCIAGWKPGGQRPCYKYAVTSELHYRRLLESIRADAEQARKEDEEQDAAVKRFSDALQVGTILSSSWGYDQTNIDFYQITARKNRIVELRHLNQETTETGFMCGTTVPRPGSFRGNTLRRRITHDAITIDSCERAYLWDGKPKYCSWYA